MRGGGLSLYNYKQHFCCMFYYESWKSYLKQGRKRPLDTPKKMIERGEREKGRRSDIEREGEIRERERVRVEMDKERESERERSKSNW